MTMNSNDDKLERRLRHFIRRTFDPSIARDSLLDYTWYKGVNHYHDMALEWTSDI